MADIVRQPVPNVPYAIASTTVPGQTGIQYVFTKWSGDSTSTLSSDSISMDSPKTITAEWKTQYYLDLSNGGHGSLSPTESGWYDSGFTVEISVSGSPESGGTGVQFLFAGWSGDSSEVSPTINIVIDGPKSIEATWKEQYYLQIVSEHGNPVGEGWYDSGCDVNVELDADCEGKFFFVKWVGEGNGCYSGSDLSFSVCMNNPITQTATWIELHHITVTPQEIQLMPSDSQQFTATAYGDSGEEKIISNIEFTWQLSNNLGNVNQTGFFTAGDESGSLSIQAKYMDIMGNADITILTTDLPVDHLEIEQNSGSVYYGQTMQFSAKAYDEDNTVLGGKTFTWSVEGGIGSIDSGGLFTASTTESAGKVICECDGVTTYVNIQVIGTRPEIDRIVISPSSVTIKAGSTQQFIATFYDSDNNELSDVTATWVLSEDDLGTITDYGLFTAGNSVIEGEISVSAGDITAVATVNVYLEGSDIIVDSIELTPNDATIVIGHQKQFIAIGKSSGTSIGGLSFTWEVIGGIGSIDQNGLFSADGIGTGSVKVTYNDISTSANVIVVNPSIAYIEISPFNVDLEAGDTIQFTATAYDNLGQQIQGVDIEWAVIGDIGEIDQNGFFTARSDGSGKISARSNGVTSNLDIVITSSEMESDGQDSGLLWVLIIVGIVCLVLVIVLISILARRKSREKGNNEKKGEFESWEINK